MVYVFSFMVYVFGLNLVYVFGFLVYVFGLNAGSAAAAHLVCLFGYEPRV